MRTWRMKQLPGHEILFNILRGSDGIFLHSQQTSFRDTPREGKTQVERYLVYLDYQCESKKMEKNSLGQNLSQSLSCFLGLGKDMSRKNLFRNVNFLFFNRLTLTMPV